MSEYLNRPTAWDPFNKIIMATEEHCLLLPVQNVHVGALPMQNSGKEHGRRNALGTHVAPVPNVVIKSMQLKAVPPVQYHDHGTVYGI